MTKLIIITIAIIIIFLILRFFACKAFYRCALLNDILKEKSSDGTFKYSQGRVYLLLSILAYYITLGIVTGKAIRPNINIDEDTVQVVIDSLQWLIMLMAGYVFGGKGMEVIKAIMTYKTESKQTQTPPQE